MRFAFYITLFICVTTQFIAAQTTSFTAQLHLVNKSPAINDVQANVEIDGGEKPFIFFWNQKDVSIYSQQATGLPEGTLIEVLIVDANQDSVRVSGEIPPESFEERIGKVMNPAVSFLNAILFKNIWSDTVRVKEYVLKAPNAIDPAKSNYILKRWVKNNGDYVKHLDVVAILEDENGEFPLYAVGNGKLQYAKFNQEEVGNGDEVFYINKRNHRSEKELATIVYEDRDILYFKNLTAKTQGIPLIVAWLVFGAIFFTFKMRFLQFRPKIFKHAVDLIRGKYDDPSKSKGEVTHFQALVTALSATIGLGNIAGVAIAISMGGPGATFWMILAGLLGMVVKFSEATLGVKYRIQNEKGEVSGGPMYYLSKGLAERGKFMKKFGKVLAFSFAILCVVGSLGIGNMFQANQAFNQLAEVPGWENFSSYGFYFGIGLAILVGLVIVGGIKSIARVTDKIVPLMVVVYVVSALAIITLNYNNLGYGIAAIYKGAFNPEAVYGGFIGVLIIGFQRAAFSNEAGIGSSPTAHAAAKTEESVSEGIVALLEPFVDTVIVCTMTALVIIFSGYTQDGEGLVGSALTSAAFSSSLGEWAIYVLSFSVFLFAFSTMISWSYYGLKAFTFLFGEKRSSRLAYNMIFLIFIVVGTSISLGAILDFSDLLILAMAFPNILGLIIMSGEIKNDLKLYLKKISSGEIQKLK